MKYVAIIIGLLLGVTITTLCLRSCDKVEPVIVDIHKVEVKYKHHIDSLHTLRKADFLKMKQDSVKAKVAEIAFKSEISRLKQKVSEKKAEAAPVIAANENVKELVNYYDSTIVVLENRIDTLQKEKTNDWVSFNKIIESYDEELKENKMFIGQQAETIQVLSKDNKKLKKGNKILKVLIPVDLVGGVLLAK